MNKDTHQAKQAGPQSVMLRWVMLDKPGIRWVRPTKPFAGMVVERPVERFEPGLGLVFDTDELIRMREQSSFSGVVFGNFVLRCGPSCLK